MPETAPDLDLAKRKLREKLRFRRRHFAQNLDGMARLAAFRAVPEPLTGATGKDVEVAAYAASGGEPDILPMLAAYGEADRLSLPHHSARDERMDFRRWRPGASLIAGPWGTPQPIATADAVIPQVIYCPLVAFDRRGRRLGQGGGHYDRYFALFPNILRIGVAWSVQEVDAVPTEATDVALDAVLTEQELIVTGDRF